MIRCIAILAILFILPTEAAIPVVSNVKVKDGDSLAFTVEFESDSRDITFQILKSQTITAEVASWSNITITQQTLLEEARWLLEFPIPEDDISFYRVMATDISIPSKDSIILLSEICSANSSLLTDMDGDFSDWIELYNPGDVPVSMEGWSLSDEVNEPGKWKFPILKIQSKESMIIFASGKDRRNPEAELHTSFKINSSGEPIILSNGRGQRIDAIRLGNMEADSTLGRKSSTESTWVTFSPETTTPGSMNGAMGSPFVESPTFSHQPGFYLSPTNILLSTLSVNHQIYYSENGNSPFDSEQIFADPILLEQNTVIRAVAVDTSGNRSKEVTGSFFVRPPHSLAVISLAAPSENFDIEDGFLYGFGDHMFNSRGTINANFPYSASNAWQDREIPISFEFFEPNGERGFQQTLGIKIFGGWGSRGYPQNSLAFFARGKYGKGKVRYPLFPDMDLEEFESFVLRNSGNDNQSTHQIPPRSEITAFGRRRSNGSYFVNGNYTLMRDAMMQRIAENLDIDRQAYRPVIVYINGEYWGIYNLREKLNEHYVASHHGVDPNQIDLIEGYGSANSGTSSHYNAMRNIMGGGSMNSESRYARITNDYLNVSSFTDYHLAVIYFQNFDIGNIKQWRDRNGGKFRWMLYDQDYGFNLWPPEVYLPAMARDFADYDNMFEFYTNTSGSGTGWPNASGRTFLLRKMLENEGFRNEFINRCADLLNTDFQSQRVIEIIHKMASRIRTEIPEHLKRWSWPSLLARNHGSPFDEEDAPLSLEQWEQHIQGLKKYALQ